MTNVPKGIYVFGTQKIGSEGWLGSNDIRSVVRKDDHFIFITDNRKWEATVSGYKRPNYIGCAVPGANMGSVKKFHNKHGLSLD